MMKRRILAFTLCSILILSLISCKKADSATTNSSVTDNTSPVTLTFWHAMGGVNGQEVQKLVDQYNEGDGKSAKITVKAVYQGAYADLMQKVKAAVQANNVKNLPDIVQVPSDSTGYIKDVKQTIWAKDLFQRDKKLKQSDFIQNNVIQFSFKNQQVGIPFASSTIILYYNKTAFKEVGLDPNSPPKTIAELGQDAAKLYKKSGNTVARYGFESEPNWYGMTTWISMQSSNGNDYSFIGNNRSGRTAAMTKATFDTDGTMKKFLDVYVPAVRDSNSKATVTNSSDQADFIAGTNAMYVGSSAGIGTVTKGVGTKFDWGTGFFPKVSADDKGGAAPGGSALYVFNRSNNASINSSCKFLEYITSPTIQLDWCKATGYFPVNAKTYDLPDFNTYLATNPYFSVAVNQLKSSNINVQEAIVGCSNIISTTFDNNIINAIQGKIDNATAVKNMATDTNKALEDYNRANS